MSQVLRYLVATEKNWTYTAARLTLATVIFAHGAQKMLGWWGGVGFEKTIAALTGMGLPTAVVFLVIVGEFFGALGLFVGLFTRVAAAGIAAILLGAIYLVHFQFGFFANWFGQQAGEGFEFHILGLGLAAVLLLGGGGAASIDRYLTSRWR